MSKTNNTQHSVSKQAIRDLREVLRQNNRFLQKKIEEMTINEIVELATQQIRDMTDPFSHYTSCKGNCNCDYNDD